MSIYNIAGITLDFTYQSDEYFKNNIEKYLVSDATKADYKINTEICDIIDTPIETPTIMYKNRSVIKTETKTIIVVRDKSGAIRELIEHTNDYKVINIKLSNHLNQKLAEQEYVLTGLVFLELATLENKLAIHGSAFVVHDDAIIIVASSGTGKSTHAEYWRETFDTFKTINDDKPLIHIKNNQLYVSGSPWSGKEKLNSNIEAPLKALVFFHQGTSNQIKELTTDEKIKQLMNHALRPRGESLMDHAINIMDTLIRFCPMFEYHATNEPSSVRPLYQRLYGGQL